MENKQPDILRAIAEDLGLPTASTVFGEAVERDGITIIPVAKVQMGIGGGGSEGHGYGAGGGLRAKPLGYIEIGNDFAIFRPIRDWAELAPLMIVGGVVGLMLLKGLKGLFK